jgi:membrane glycosyltransferase
MTTSFEYVCAKEGISVLPPECAAAFIAKDIFKPLKCPRRRQKFDLRTTVRRIAVLLLGIFTVYTIITYTYTPLIESTNLFIGYPIIILLMLNSIWLTFQSSVALVGFISILTRSKPPLSIANQPSKDNEPAKTAILMPVFNEEPDSVFRGAVAMLNSITEQKCAFQFHLFILSDSDDSSLIAREENNFVNARKCLVNDLHLYYRRRSSRTEGKAGNIAEWCSRWGDGYDFMIVLDADSLMSGKTVVELTRTIQAHPRVGILQAPSIQFGSKTMFGRCAQFGNHLYDDWAPMLTWGTSLLFGGDGTYFGHNAIFRLEAFIGSARLPVLTGRPPLGGYVLSHDFVEAALINNQGWQVYVCPEVQESYEQFPPTLLDWGKRERRWCQGNLQHCRLLFAPSLGWGRIHLLIGIMHVATSIAWCLLALLVLAATHFQREGAGLESLWMEIEFALVLLAIAPRLLSLVCLTVSPSLRASLGGGPAAFASAIIDTLITILVAPARILIRTNACIDVILRRDSGWTASRRKIDPLSWRQVFLYHRGHALTGAVFIALVAGYGPTLLATVLPLMGSLIVIVPLSKVLGSTKLADCSLSIGLFVIPEEKAPSPLIVQATGQQPKCSA